MNTLTKILLLVGILAILGFNILKYLSHSMLGDKVPGHSAKDIF